MNNEKALEALGRIHKNTHAVTSGYDFNENDSIPREEDFDEVRAALLRLESAEKELAEIKGRAEEIRKRYANRSFGIGYADVAGDIGFIIKGEGK